MSDLDEDTATKLLRILVEQSVNSTNSAIEIPSSEPPSSVLTVSSLWFLSIMSSLAATTWAILCLESCAFLSDGVQAEDYEEMAEKRQRRFEAMKFWRMHFVVAGIPFFLHVSLFLFLAGLWLRLRDVNKQLEFIVGIPSLLIALTYVTVTLLPIFTDAPFSTSVSELAQPVVDEIWRIHRFIRPPRAFVLLARAPPWIASLPLVGSLRDTLSSFKLSPDPGLIRGWLISPLKPIYGIAGPFVHVFWESARLFIIPTFGPDQNPFNELTKLKVGHEDKGIHIRALFWLMNTPLSRDEVKEILKEFTKYWGKDEEPLDRTTIRLLVLSMSSILENGKVSGDEQPMFDHCTKILAKGMDREFGDGEHSQRITFWSTTVSRNLSPHFHLDTSDKDTPDYWEHKAIPALWLCPSAETIHHIVDQLNQTDVRSMEALQLRCIVRGLHAARFSCFEPNPYKSRSTAALVLSACNKSVFNLIPDFSLWDWNSSSSNTGLDKALLGFLRGLFAAFYDTQRPDRPTTTPSLIIGCLEVFGAQPDLCTPELHNALCFFVAVIQRSDPKIFEEGPSVADALRASVESYSSRDVSCCTLATWLRAIAYGPKSSIQKGGRSLTNLYANLPDPIRTDGRCLEGFLNANAAALQAILAAGSNFATFLWQRVSHHQAAQEICTGPFFTHNAPLDFVRKYPNCRLPYLYSLAIALSYVAEERDRKYWTVADLLVTRGEQEGITIDRALDVNILVVTILMFVTHVKYKTVEQERVSRTAEQERNSKTKFLKSLENIVFDRTNWRTRWKSIYLITDIVYLLSQMNNQHERDERTKLIDKARELLEEGHDRVPSDWERKREGLVYCGLETRVKELLNERGGTGEGVYEWSGRENVPYLSLYNSRWTSTAPISHWVTKLQR